MLKIYTDGSCRKNGQGGWGYVVYDGDTIVKVAGAQVPNTTNNKMELTAIIEALQAYGVQSDEWDIPIIYSDSIYALKSLGEWVSYWETHDWLNSQGKPVENQDLIKKALWLLRHDHYARLEKIPGHFGISGNEIADAIATGDKQKLTKLLMNEKIISQG